MKKKVAVTQRLEKNIEYGETRDALDFEICKLLVECDAVPIPVPNALNTEKRVKEWLLAIEPEAFLFSGGSNFGVSPNRDLLESNLYEYVLARGIPSVGICRGMQLFITQSGGSLKKVNGHIKTSHRLTGTYTHRVNSYHEYAPDQLPGCMDPIAVAEDGNVEAIKHKVMPIEGWMWHPERSEENRGLHSCLIKSKLQI